VVGISFFGARAYAEHFSKRLPTEAQWEQAAAWLQARLPDGAAAAVPGSGSASGPAAEHMHMMDSGQGHAGQVEQKSPPAMDLLLVDPAIHVREWAVNGGGGERSPVVSWDSLTNDEKSIARYRSEGFADVGFRTVLLLRQSHQ
jgi:hypothetical protein